MRYDIVSDEEFGRVRGNARIYLMPFEGALGEIVRLTVPKDYLLNLARETIWFSQKQEADKGRKLLKKTEKVMGAHPTQQGSDIVRVARAKRTMQDSVKYYDNMEKDLGDKLHIFSEEAIIYFDESEPFGPKSRGDPFQILSYYRIDNADMRHISAFRKAVVHKINSGLQEEIKKANGITFGYVFDELVEKFRQYGTEKAYRMAWAFLVNDNHAKNFLSSVLAYHANLMAKVESAGYDTVDAITRLHNSGATDEGSKVNFVKPDPVGLGWAVLEEMFRPYKDAEDMALLANRAKYLEGIASFFLAETLGEYKARIDAEKRSELERSRREELTGKLAAEVKDREVALTEREKEVNERNKKISELTSRLAELGETNLTKLGATVKTQSEAIAKRDRRIESLEESEELLEKENDALSKEIRKLRQKSKTGGKLGKNPYFDLRDDLDGTAWADVSDEATSLIYGAFRRDVVSGKLKVGEKRLIKFATDELPENMKDAKLEPVLERLKMAGVYINNRGLTLNTNTDEISDDVLKNFVKRMMDLRAVGEI